MIHKEFTNDGTYRYKFAFQNKTEYLAFVKKWKIAYKRLTVVIRELKKTTKALQPLTQNLWYNYIYNGVDLRTAPEANDLINRQHDILEEVLENKLAWGAGKECHTASEFATYLITLRKEAKAQSKEMRDVILFMGAD